MNKYYMQQFYFRWLYILTYSPSFLLTPFLFFSLSSPIPLYFSLSFFVYISLYFYLAYTFCLNFQNSAKYDYIRKIFNESQIATFYTTLSSFFSLFFFREGGINREWTITVLYKRWPCVIYQNLILNIFAIANLNCSRVIQSWSLLSLLPHDNKFAPCAFLFLYRGPVCCSQLLQLITSNWLELI